MTSNLFYPRLWTLHAPRRYVEPTSRRPRPPWHRSTHDREAALPDEQQLAKLGYSQELDRSWSGFSNFAISFSIISILAGCFTTFGQAWNNGGPIAISWGWPVISTFILVIGLTMSELVSAYPTSGGIYWWASKMGGPAAGFFTGWLNLIGLLAVTASVAYGAATFFDLTLSTLSSSYADGYSLTRVFITFLVIMALGAVLNIFGGHLMAIINNVSVWWHVVGVAVIVLVLLLVPSNHESFSFVFTEHINNSGFGGGTTSGKVYWFLVLPLGFLLTQYTITGYDASAHLSEETASASNAAAKGIWQSIAYSAIGGWILLLAFLFAVQDPTKVTAGINAGGTAVDVIFGQALGQGWHVLILFISTAGQLFCAAACLTSASRMTFAFSRDGAIPGSRAVVEGLPQQGARQRGAVRRGDRRDHHAARPGAGEHRHRGGADHRPDRVLRGRVDRRDRALPGLRDPDLPALAPGLGLPGRVVEPRLEVQVDVPRRGGRDRDHLDLLHPPDGPRRRPWNADFHWKFVNYAPILTGGTLLLLTIWWFASARNWFTGPKHTIDDAVLEAFED